MIKFRTFSHSLAYEDEEEPEKKEEYVSPYQSKNKTPKKVDNQQNSRYQRQTSNSGSTQSQKTPNRYESKTSSYSSNDHSSGQGNAQDRFKNARSISSDQYFGTDKEISHERQSKINQFSGATSISSSQYFGDDESSGSGSGKDLGDDIIETAKNDLQKLKSSLITGGRKLAEMTKDFFNDFQDRYN